MKLPPAPQHLSPEATAWWRRVVRLYELEEHEYAVLQLACEQLDRITEARAATARDSAFISGRFGIRAHPALAAERNAVLVFSRLVRQLGLKEVELNAKAQTLKGWPQVVN